MFWECGIQATGFPNWFWDISAIRCLWDLHREEIRLGYTGVLGLTRYHLWFYLWISVEIPSNLSGSDLVCSFTGSKDMFRHEYGGLNRRRKSIIQFQLKKKSGLTPWIWAGEWRRYDFQTEDHGAILSDKAAIPKECRQSRWRSIADDKKISEEEELRLMVFSITVSNRWSYVCQILAMIGSGRNNRSIHSSSGSPNERRNKFYCFLLVFLSLINGEWGGYGIWFMKILVDRIRLWSLNILDRPTTMSGMISLP